MIAKNIRISWNGKYKGQDIGDTFIITKKTINDRIEQGHQYTDAVLHSVWEILKLSFWSNWGLEHEDFVKLELIGRVGMVFKDQGNATNRFEEIVTTTLKIEGFEYELRGIDTKYISTTLPYINSEPHMGHLFEFVLADVIASYWKSNRNNEVIFNVGVDEHGQKVQQRAIEKGYGDNVAEYCENQSMLWFQFCDRFKIEHTNFYRTSSAFHEIDVHKFFNATDNRDSLDVTYDKTKSNYYEGDYQVDYCVGCESPIHKSEQVNGKCPIHGTELIPVNEKNLFFRLSKYSEDVKDILIDKRLSNELKGIINNMGDISITRSKENVTWGISYGNEQVFYVWYEALLNYISVLTRNRPHEVADIWQNAIIICGKDNLKFQAYILQALMLAADYPQNKGVLVHGTILDEYGRKMSKTQGNVVSPIEQYEKYGLDPLRYYLTVGLNTFGDSKYTEQDLVDLWNTDIVNGLGNTISRVLHLVDILKVDVSDIEQQKLESVEKAFDSYSFNEVRLRLNDVIHEISKEIGDKKPWESSFVNTQGFMRRMYQKLYSLIPYYKILLKEAAPALDVVFQENKKIILFKKIIA
jgi:methionyl-tRNA synthetase